MSAPLKVGFFLSHPIQYYSPWFRRLAARTDLHVHYFVRQDGGGQARAGFGVAFEWDLPLLEGYAHRFLRNVARRPSVRGFWNSNTPEVDAICHEQRFDVAVVVGWNRLSSWQVIRACRRHGIPVLMRGDSVLRTDRFWMLRRMLKFFPYRAMLRQLDGHLIVGRRNRKYLKFFGVPDAQLHFVPHFVDDEWFAARAREARASGAAAALRHAQGIPATATVGLFCGKLIPKKRVADLIQALARLQDIPDLHLLVAGDGPLRESLQALARRCAPGRVHFLGFRNQTELPACYAAADFLALPSGPDETWGLVANEAMACGLPVLLSQRVGSVSDLVTPGETGDSFPSGNIPALTGRMRTLVDDLRRDRTRIQAAVAARIAQYSVAAATDATLEAFYRVARRN